METFNIVELIEKNPNTKISSTYNNKLIDRIKNNLISLTCTKELVEINNKLLNEVLELKKSNKEILEKLNSIQVKNTRVTNFGETNKNIGNRVQKINSETGLLIKYYDSD